MTSNKWYTRENKMLRITFTIDFTKTLFESVSRENLLEWSKGKIILRIRPE